MTGRLLAIIALLPSAPLASLAQAPDPCSAYLTQPTPRGYAAAREHLDSLLSKNSNDRQALLLSAQVDRTNLSGQVERLWAARDSLEPGQQFGLANLLLEMNDFHRAVDLYQALNRRAPEWSCPWRHKGQALYKLGKLPEAERSLLAAVGARATHYDAYVWLARVRKDMGKHRQALESMTKAFENKGRDVEEPAREVAAGEDVKLLEEILAMNGFKQGRLEAERDRIASLSKKESARQ